MEQNEFYPPHAAYEPMDYTEVCDVARAFDSLETDIRVLILALKVIAAHSSDPSSRQIAAHALKGGHGE